MRRATAAGLAALFVCFLSGSSGDPGLLLEIDRERFELTARDVRDGERGPRLRVAVGSPAHATPSGVFPLHRVIENPAWEPGPEARERGAAPVPPSSRGPLGVAKIPFAAGGAIALHGGGNPLLLGKPVSLGCVRAADPDLRALLDWMQRQSALADPRVRANGEIVRALRRPARLVVR